MRSWPPRRSGWARSGRTTAQELAAKRAALDELGRGVGVRWHFLGAIQTNKIHGLAALVDCWQSVSRATEGERIARPSRGHRLDPGSVLFRRRAARLRARQAVPALAGTLTGFGLDVTGLMAVAPRRADEARAAFATVVRLADDLGLPERSIGMTEDLELAVAAGSTMIRVGRALFGERPLRPTAPG